MSGLRFYCRRDGTAAASLPDGGKLTIRRRPELDPLGGPHAQEIEIRDEAGEIVRSVIEYGWRAFAIERAEKIAAALQEGPQ